MDLALVSLRYIVPRQTPVPSRLYRIRKIYILSKWLICRSCRWMQVRACVSIAAHSRGLGAEARLPIGTGRDDIEIFKTHSILLRYNSNRTNRYSFPSHFPWIVRLQQVQQEMNRGRIMIIEFVFHAESLFYNEDCQRMSMIGKTMGRVWVTMVSLG